MAFYEHTFIIRQDVSVAQVDSLVDGFRSVIEEKGGSVPKVEYWGLRTLAYRIRKNRKAHYVFMNVDAPPAAIQEVQRQMLLHEDILRFLTVSVDALDPNPSSLAQNRVGRDFRLDRYEEGGSSLLASENRAFETQESKPSETTSQGASNV